MQQNGDRDRCENCGADITLDSDESGWWWFLTDPVLVFTEHYDEAHGGWPEVVGPPPEGTPDVFLIVAHTMDYGDPCHDGWSYAVPDGSCEHRPADASVSGSRYG